MPEAARPSADHLFDTALSAKLRGDVEAAVEGFQQVLSAYPHHVQAYLQLGKCEIQRGDAEAALTALRRGAKVSQRSAPLLAELGFLQLVTGDRERAEKVLGAARRLAKRNVRALTGLAWLHMQRREWGKALGLLDELLAVSGSSFAAHYFLAQVHEVLGKIGDAQQEWFLVENICREMIEVTDGQVAAHYYLGETLRVTRTWAAAREDFDTAARHAPADGSGYLFGMGLAVPWGAVLEAAATACDEDGDATQAAAWRAGLADRDALVPEADA